MRLAAAVSLATHAARLKGKLDDPRAVAALTAAAHALKGMLGNLAAGPAAAQARRLEALGRRGDLSEAPAALRQLEDESERLREALHSLGRDAAFASAPDSSRSLTPS